MADIRGAGFPWWWNWLERQLPPSSSNPITTTPSQPQTTLKNFLLAPQTPQRIKQTPKSTILPAATTAAKPSRNSPAAFRTPPASLRSYSRPRGINNNNNNEGDYYYYSSPLFKDDESLNSCPPFSVPHYMASTVSAKAKLRAGSSTNTPTNITTPIITTTTPIITTTTTLQSKSRISFPFKWNKKANLFSNISNKDDSIISNNSQRANLDHLKNQSLQSLGNLSVDSTASLPAGVGRRPFNRFV